MNNVDLLELISERYSEAKREGLDSEDSFRAAMEEAREVIAKENDMFTALCTEKCLSHRRLGNAHFFCDCPCHDDEDQEENEDGMH